MLARTRWICSLGSQVAGGWWMSRWWAGGRANSTSTNLTAASFNHVSQVIRLFSFETENQVSKPKNLDTYKRARWVFRFRHTQNRKTYVFQYLGFGRFWHAVIHI